MKYLCEVEISTAESNVHQARPGVFHVAISNSICYGKNPAMIGVKLGSIRVPKQEKNLTFKLLMSKKLATLDLKKSIGTYTVNYASYGELCDIIESLAKASLPTNGQGTVDFSYPSGHAAHGQLPYEKLVKLQYRNSRFFLDLHWDLQIIMSGSLAKILGFDDEILDSYSDEERIDKSDEKLFDECDDQLILLPKLSHSSKNRKLFVECGDDEFRFILYDKIESAFNKGNGARYPSLFEYNLFDRSRMQVIEKKLNVTSLRDLSFGLFRTCDDNPFMRNNDYSKNPFIFTLILYA